MDLREVSEHINGEYRVLLQELSEEVRVQNNRREKAVTEYHIAASQGDLSENAAYADAVEEMTQATLEIARIEERIALMSTANIGSYKSIGMIVTYTTFTLKGSDGSVRTFKLFPEGVTDLDRGMLAKDSIVGKHVWMKKVGDSFTVLDRVTEEPTTYTVVDLW